MATPIIMPRQGQSVESCIITKWHKNKGERVEAGELLFSYETDKASFDEEAKAGGILLDVFFEEGDDVPCLTNVCVIGNAGESAEEFNPKAQKTGPVTEIQRKENTVPDKNPAQAAPSVESQAYEAGSVKISPRARGAAEKNGVDYRYAQPSGPQGRIIEKDVLALRDAGITFTPAAREEHLKGEPGGIVSGSGLGGRITVGDLNKAAPEVIEQEYHEVKIPNIRKVIAKAMQHSLASTAQLTLNTSFDAGEILEFRKKLKAGKERLEIGNITINDIIIYAVSRILPYHKDLNAHFLEDRMLYFKNVNIGVAVQTERGLMVPAVMNADRKTLNEISKEVKQLAKECQSGSINPDLTKNGTFTVTNLGALEIESFTPILNPPQTGILGVNNIIQRAREVEGEYEFYPAMGLSLTFDHRALDGAPAAKFLKDLKNGLENFSALLAR